MALTDDQVRKVKLGRRALQPNYFSAASSNEIPIGRDCEDALILATPTAKSQAVAYLKLLLDANQGSSPYSKLLEEFTEKQVENANAKKAEFDAILEKFNKFKDGLTTGASSSTSATGLVNLLSAMNKGLGRLNAQSQAAQFDSNFAGSAQSEFAVTLTDAQKREMRSWIRVILLYP